MAYVHGLRRLPRCLVASSSRCAPVLASAIIPTRLCLPTASSIALRRALRSPQNARQLHTTLPAFSSVTANTRAPLDGLSFVVGDTAKPLDERTLGALWNDLVRDYGKSPALVSRHEGPDQHLMSHPAGENEGDCLRWTYEEMDERVNALARGLLRIGMKKGDRVGAFLGNGSMYAMLQWATAKIGCILVCINPASRPNELLAALNLSGCKSLFIPPTLRKNQHIPILHDLLPSLATSTPHNLDEPACPSLRSVVMVDNTRLGAQAFAEYLKKESLEGSDARNVFEWEGKGVPGAEPTHNEEVINIQFTSGTTGLPKGVGLTHRNLLNNGALIGDCMDLKPPSPSEGWEGERLCNSPPMFHCFGLVLGNLAFWTHAGCLVYPSETFDPSLSLRAVVLEKCTALHGVPTMFIAELGLLEDYDDGKTVANLSDLPKLDFSSLRTGIAAGSPVPDEVMRKLMKRMGIHELTVTYGQTETSPATIMSSTTDDLELRCTTVGRVLPHTHIRIVDPAHPSYPSHETPSLPVGTPGEIWSGGYALQKEYWNNQKETDKTMFRSPDGVRWLMTGDQGVMDKGGYVKIVGRIKDIIIRGGENLFPVVIENRALLLPGVADCSIVAVSDPVMHEVAGAFVQREHSAEGRALTGKDISIHIKDILSHQSSPDWVWWLGEDGVPAEYPKTASGKIRKVELREWAEDLVKRGIGRTRGTY